MKRAVIVTGAVVLVTVAVVVAIDLAGWPGLAPYLVTKASPGVTMDEGARVHFLFKPRLEAPRLQVKGDQGQALGDAQGLVLNWAWGDIWKWRHGEPLRLRLVQADSLTVDWQRDADGHTAWPLHPDGAKPKRPTAVPEIDHLVIRQGAAHIDDAPLQLLGDARFATQADGHWKADMKGKLRGQQLALNAEASAGLALLSSPEAGVPPVQLRVALNQGAQGLSFVGTASSLLDARSLDGQLQVKGNSLEEVGRPFGVTLPRTPPFELAGRLQHATGVWKLDGVKARVGQSRLGGDYAFDTRPKRPLLTGTLRGGPLRLADLGPAVGADTPPSRKGRLLPDRQLDLPALNAMDARVGVALSQLDLGTASLAPLAPVNGSVLLQGGVLDLTDLKAGIAGGLLAGSIQLDTRVTPPHMKSRLDITGMAIEQWLKPQNKLLTASPLTGRMRADLDVQGHGRSTAEVLGTLDGPIRVRIENGSISHLLTEAMGLDVAQGLGMLFKGDDNLPLNCARLDGRFTAGVLRPRTAILDNRDTRVDLDGRVNLADETLDLRLVAKPKDFSPLTLRAPVRLLGTLAEPHVALEGKRLGGRAIAALALGALAPPAALLAFVDPGENLPPVDCSMAPNPNAEPAKATAAEKPVAKPSNAAAAKPANSDKR